MMRLMQKMDQRHSDRPLLFLLEGLALLDM